MRLACVVPGLLRRSTFPGFPRSVVMRNVFGWSMVLSGCLVGIALSQNAAQPDRTPPRPGGAVAQPQRGERPLVPGGAERGAASADQQIAACIYIGCHNHIQIA